MSDYSKIAWGVLSGVVLGFAASSAISRGKLRPCTTKMMSYGIDLKDKLVETAENLKEDLEDMTAEAKEEARKRAAKKQQETKAKDEILPADTEEVR